MLVDVDPLVAAAPPSHSLIKAALTPNAPADAHWIDGIQWRPDPCDPGGGWWDCPADGGDPPDDKTIADEQRQAWESYRPWVLWVGDACSPVGDREFVARARRMLVAVESHRIARELWTGSYATSAAFPNRYLSQAGEVALVEGGAAVGHISALAALEQALGDCSPAGEKMIHCTRRTLTHWAHQGLVEREGNSGVVRTIAGTVVVADTGYPGTGPGETYTPGESTADTDWAYGTSQVVVFRSPVTVVPESESEAVNRATNLVEFRAEESVAAVWDGCCHVGVRVDHTTATSTTGS
jgi:hypothetical protein